MIDFIAEVSSNHGRDLERCFAFIDRAGEIGCTAVKFQLFKVRALFAPEALAADPAKLAREDWELPVDFLAPLAERCRARGLRFAATPFYLEAVEELRPHVDFYKIASYELLWDGLLAACAATGKPVILSCGMASLDEVRHAVEVIRDAGGADLTLLHCVSGYPAPPEACNLAAIETLRAATGCPVGWSDHSANPGVMARAIHRWGARVVEFHLDLDARGAEYAAGHCWLPGKIGAVIADAAAGLAADGDGVKRPTAAEQAECDWRADPADGLRPLRKIRRSL
jgi:N-acetylneuraminate synthase